MHAATTTLRPIIRTSVAIFLLLASTGAHPLDALSQYAPEDIITADPVSVDGEFGEALAYVGTLNGRPIYIVGSSGATDQGGAFLINGDDGSTRTPLTTQRPTFGGQFGAAVGVIGDVSGDGFNDVIVGAPREDYIEAGAAASDAGVAYIYDGDTGDFLLELQSSASNVLTGRRFGATVAGIGDVSGDNIPDAIVGAPEQSANGAGQAGKAYVFSGADGSVIQVLTGAEINSGRFGASVAGIGDIVGTASPDIAVGAPGEDITVSSDVIDQAGKVYVIDGDTFGSTTISSDNAENGGNFGNTVSRLPTASDPDLLVGARREDVNNISDAGRAYIIDGNNLSGAQTPLVSDMAESQGAFGTSLTGISDVTGDGISDVLVGAPDETVGGIGSAGRAYAFSGADGSLLATLASPSVEDGRFGRAVSGTDYPIIAAPEEDASGTPRAGRLHRYVPGIELVDGRNGESYSPADGTPATDANPVGRFKLSTTVSGANLTDLTVTNGTTTPTGVTSIELWASADATFDASSDTELAATAYADNVTFSGLAEAVPSGDTYYFVVVDLDATADGDIEPLLQSEADLSLSAGQLVTYNGTTASTFTDAFLSTANTTLPVELASFTGTPSGHTVVLTWSTLSETNNAGFVVERRPSEGETLAPWSRVGSVDGAGTTTEIQSYRFTDANLPPGVRSVDYRLRQQDVDGPSTLSDPITVRINTGERLAITRSYPNPASNRISVDINLPKTTNPGDVELELHDVLGRRVKSMSGVPGSGATTTRLRVGDLPSGVYFLRIRADGRSDTHRLTIVK